MCFFLQNDDIETDINKLRPKQMQTRPFDELRVYEHFCVEFTEDFKVRTVMALLFNLNIWIQGLIIVL